MSIALETPAPEIRFADAAPVKHRHPDTIARVLTDFVNDDGEICLICGVCELAWHTGIIELNEDEDDERDLSIHALRKAATKWIQAQQMPLPFVFSDSPAAPTSKRRYQVARPVDISKQMNMFEMALAA